MPDESRGVADYDVYEMFEPYTRDNLFRCYRPSDLAEFAEFLLAKGVDLSHVMIRVEERITYKRRRPT